MPRRGVRRARRLTGRVLQDQHLVRVLGRAEELGEEAHVVQRHGRLDRQLAVLVEDPVGVVEVKEHRRPGLLVARGGELAALGLHEATLGALVLEQLKHLLLDRPAEKVVLLPANLDVDRDGHDLVRAELPHP